jgi:hypothetical protein
VPLAGTSISIPARSGRKDSGDSSSTFAEIALPELFCSSIVTVMRLVSPNDSFHNRLTSICSGRAIWRKSQAQTISAIASQASRT